MTLNTSNTSVRDRELSLYHLLDPKVLANPYPLYARLREEDPVHWDPFLQVWVVTRYIDVQRVLLDFSARCAPSPRQLSDMGLNHLTPIAQVTVRQMLFLDPPAHTRLRGLCSAAFTPRRVESLREHIQQIADSLIDAVAAKGAMDVLADFAAPFPAIVTAEMLGLPTQDHQRMKTWSATFAEILGNFQHNPGRVTVVLKTLEEMTNYFRDAIRRCRSDPGEGVINALVNAEIDGDRLSDDEIIANIIITMVGGQETTTNLIGNGLLTLLRHPAQLLELRDDPSVLQSGVEELLRFESPSQHTARIAPENTEIGCKAIRKGQVVRAVMAAGNRDPERFLDPDRLDLRRQDNRHLAFGWAGHFCFGAPLARIEGQIAFCALLRRLENLRLLPAPLEWRFNLGLRGLTRLPLAFDSCRSSQAA